RWRWMIRRARHCARAQRYRGVAWLGSRHGHQTPASREQGLIARIPGGDAQAGRLAATCLTTHFPAEAVTTHRNTFVPMCRQVFGLADGDLVIRLLAPASQPRRASACGYFRFRFTAAGQFRIYTG